jgi:hypothetical protein
MIFMVRAPDSGGDIGKMASVDHEVEMGYAGSVMKQDLTIA